MADKKPWEASGDGEDGEEELDDNVYKATKDATLFAIEVNPSMLEAGTGTPSKDSPAVAALKAASLLIQQRIISSPNDMMGILLYGTRETKFVDADLQNSTAYPHCYLLVDLNIPAAEDVKALNLVISGDSEESTTILTPSTEPVLMSNLLFCINQIFTSRAANFISKRLFLVTDNDNPHGDSEDNESSAIVRAKDLYDLGIEIQLYPISKAGSDFDRTLFYNDVVYQSLPVYSSSGIAALPVPQVSHSPDADGISLLESLLSDIKSRTVAKRSLFSKLPFEIGPGLTISVNGYLLFKKQEIKRSCYIYSGSGHGDEDQEPQLATAQMIQTMGESDKVVAKEDIQRAYNFGGEQVIFTTDEMAKIRNFGDPVIRIIGFRPLSQLNIWANLRPATFLYPTEEGFVGSTRTFAALHQKLTDSSKVALVWFIARRNATPAVAAIIAGAEDLDAMGKQIVPAGLWLTPLPFADDVRKWPEPRQFEPAHPDVVEQTRAIIEQLTLRHGVYDPSKYPNPALQWHFRILKAMALEEEVPDQHAKSKDATGAGFSDKTTPKYKQIEKVVGSDLVRLKQLLEQHVGKAPASFVEKPAKRPALKAGGRTTVKRAK
ncbi:MAG: ATP-dependent DNA helicase II subunit 1 [Vezdaea aestivalis]|nr:MAG: ATP-dependent DNA helicase II subunit 1 [Vezdaea aestivalis]